MPSLFSPPLIYMVMKDYNDAYSRVRVFWSEILFIIIFYFTNYRHYLNFFCYRKSREFLFNFIFDLLLFLFLLFILNFLIFYKFWFSYFCVFFHFQILSRADNTTRNIYIFSTIILGGITSILINFLPKNILQKFI